MNLLSPAHELTLANVSHIGEWQGLGLDVGEKMEEDRLDREE